MEGRPLSAADVKTLRRPISCLLARVGVYIYGDDGLVFYIVFSFRGEHYHVELSFFGGSEGLAVAVPASRWQK